MLPIRQNGLVCVKAGVTSIDELNRVTVKEWV
jgi:type II secretory ATPase GspE/PulE/Tfp pilus assembly ATPase PilB-like protein